MAAGASAIAAVAVLTILAFGVGWPYRQSARTSRATEALLEIQRLADSEEYTGAFALAEEVEDVLPDDGRLERSSPGEPPINFVLKGGRALVVPIYKGTYERRSGLDSTWPNMSHGYVD